MKRLSWLLSAAARITVHLVVPMGAVIDPDRLRRAIDRQQQDDRVVDDLAAVRRELDPEQGVSDVIEDSLIVGAHETRDGSADNRLQTT